MKKEATLALIGRVTLASIFVLFGFMKIGTFAGMVAYAASAGVPFPQLAIVVAIVVELIGGLMILVGYKTKLVALAIAIFLVPVTLYFHTNFGDQVNLTMFWKNLSIFGGLLILAAHGAGSYSIDAKLARR
ncbi:DoxX family protein [Patescibacteria group bacterium]|nr:MAG: DoxX family protein [Patescibacteria group bacterium]